MTREIKSLSDGDVRLIEVGQIGRKIRRKSVHAETMADQLGIR